jgi:hypothetical protein
MGTVENMTMTQHGHLMQQAAKLLWQLTVDFSCTRVTGEATMARFFDIDFYDHLD